MLAVVEQPILDEDPLEIVGVPLHVGDEYLDARARPPVADGADRGGNRGGASVVEVVACDHRDDGVVEAHLLDRLGDARRLVRVGGLGLAGVDETEAALPSAPLAENHEGCRLLRIAFHSVGALGIVTNRFQS